MRRQQLVQKSLAGFGLALLLVASLVGSGQAIGSSQNPQSGSTGLQGTVNADPPKTGATISVPVNGRSFATTPITVSGLCPTGLLVKLFSNNIFVGSVQCTGGSFSIQVDLFNGQNDLVARVYDALDQPGPDSNTVTVTFQDSQFTAFGERVSLTSAIAKLGADPGATLTWPIILSGGNGPYAISVDWGDGTALSLQSAAFAGPLNITHVYKSAGVYRVIVKATDVNGQTAFLQLVGIANGKIAQATGSSSGGNTGTTTVVNQTPWWIWPLTILFCGLTFWLGRRSELVSIHRQIERQTDRYQKDLSL